MAQFFPMLPGIPLIGFWVWMLIDLAKNDYLTRETKNNWFIAFMLLNFFAALWYYLVEYRPRHL